MVLSGSKTIDSYEPILFSESKTARNKRRITHMSRFFLVNQKHLNRTRLLNHKFAIACCSGKFKLYWLVVHMNTFIFS